MKFKIGKIYQYKNSLILITKIDEKRCYYKSINVLTFLDSFEHNSIMGRIWNWKEIGNCPETALLLYCSKNEQNK